MPVTVVLRPTAAQLSISILRATYFNVPPDLPYYWWVVSGKQQFRPAETSRFGGFAKIKLPSFQIRTFAGNWPNATMLLEEFPKR